MRVFAEIVPKALSAVPHLKYQQTFLNLQIIFSEKNEERIPNVVEQGEQPEKRKAILPMYKGSAGRCFMYNRLPAQRAVNNRSPRTDRPNNRAPIGWVGKTRSAR